jgi:hypothetical protein
MANNQKKQGNRKQAPKLVFNGSKFNQNKGFYQIPQEAADIMFKEFARQPAFIRLMLVLIGTEPGFGLAEQWVLDRTGMNHASYLKTRDALVELGWLTCEDGQIAVNYDKIYGRIDSIPQKNCIDSILQKEQEALASLCIESIPQNSKMETKCIESIPQKNDKKQKSIESIPQKICIESIPQNDDEKNNGGYSLNTSNLYSVNTSKEDLEYSLNTENCIDSIPIIYKEIDNIDIDKLEYITMRQIRDLVQKPTWIGEDIVQLANGKVFRVQKEEVPIDWGSML